MLKLTRFIKNSKKVFSDLRTSTSEGLKTTVSKHKQLRGVERPKYSLNKDQDIHGFKLTNIKDYKDFDMRGYFLEHKRTGAKYFHLDSADINNGLAIHFRTPAFDDTGIFHILEHFALCGSRKYPIRDPFFNMIKRSLNSYMNAWTGPDFTMYPFAAHNLQDYANLRDVYCDATFFPKLEYLDFLQEGWRHEFLDPNDKNSGLVYKGVVLNEMKGAMSAQDAHFLQKLQSHLLPKTTYRYNSGGDPRHIPTLKYEDILKTHKRFYHPTNSQFISYGDANFVENLEFLEEKLKDFESRGERMSVENSERWDKPKEIEEFYQPEVGVGNPNVAKFALAYLCNDINADPYITFKL